MNELTEEKLERIRELERRVEAEDRTWTFLGYLWVGFPMVMVVLTYFGIVNGRDGALVSMTVEILIIIIAFVNHLFLA